MKNLELQTLLSNLPDDAEIFTWDAEWGFINPRIVREIEPEEARFLPKGLPMGGNIYVLVDEERFL
jgi:hypothetical protein